MTLPPRSDALEAFEARLRAQLDEVTRSQRAAQEGATHEEMRAEDPKDMRSTELSYLARGLAKRAAELSEALRLVGRIDAVSGDTDGPIRVGSLVSVEDDEGECAHYLIVPAAGGERLDVGGVPLRTVTPPTPLGRQLLGSTLGDRLSVEGPAGSRELEIVEIA